MRFIQFIKELFTMPFDPDDPYEEPYNEDPEITVPQLNPENDDEQTDNPK